MAPVMFRPVIAADAIAFYVRKILLPIHFITDYGRSPEFLYAQRWLALDGLLTVAMLVIAWLARRKLPVVTAAIAIFVLAILPTSGLLPFDFQEYSTVADRYAYLAMLGLALLIGWLLTIAPRWLTPIVAVVIAAMFGLTVHQIGYWKNDAALFGYATQVNPTSWMAHDNYAFGLLRSDPDEAIRQTQIALRLRPDRYRAHMTMAAAKTNKGDLAGAVEQLRIAAFQNPRDPEVHRFLAQDLDQLGDASAAIVEYQKQISMVPDDAVAHGNLGALLAENGRPAEAAAEYRQAIQINPNSQNARQGLEMLAKSTKPTSSPAVAPAGVQVPP